MKLLTMFQRPQLVFDPYEHLLATALHSPDLMDLDALRALTLNSHHSPIKRKKCCEQQQPPRKYRIVCNCPGYTSESIKTEFTDDKKQLFVSGHYKQQVGKDEDEYTLREFRRKFALPENLDRDKMTSFLTPSGQFVVEIPFVPEEKPVEEEEDDDEDESFVRLVDNKETGLKEARMHVTLPVKNIDPAKVEVSIKDRDVIVRLQDEQLSFLRRSTMPAGTQMEHLKCALDSKLGNRLVLSAPVKLEQHKDVDGWTRVTIQHKSAEQQQQQQEPPQPEKKKEEDEVVEDTKKPRTE